MNVRVHLSHLPFALTSISYELSIGGCISLKDCVAAQGWVRHSKFLMPKVLGLLTELSFTLRQVAKQHIFSLAQHLGNVMPLSAIINLRCVLLLIFLST